jgi:3-methyladenine DNA glycosylase AlkC
MARNTNGTGFSLKDELFNEVKVTKLANELAVVLPGFKLKPFIAKVCKPFAELELKERLNHIAAVLDEVLDPDPKKACAQIVAALPAPLDPSKTDDDFGDFIYAPYGKVVVARTLNKQHYKFGLKTLRELTMRFSMEDAIRPFINTFPKETFAVLEAWATDTNYHVRRLVSEGTRPLLPWSSRLTIDVRDPVPLLTTLHADQTRYVTRSVANHLNDISKLDPALTLNTLKAWHKEKEQASKELNWMTRHALRTLVKQGDSSALALLGYHNKPAITVSDIAITPHKLAIGEALHLSCTITAQKREPLMVDYAIGFVKANGSTANKVFKIKQVTLEAGESITLTKRHPIKANSSTFTYYPGEQQVTLQINGQTYPAGSFKLQA